MTDTTTISERGLAVFALAVDLQLASGKCVTRVSTDDGADHHADGEGVGEFQRLGLVAIDSGRMRFTETGEAMIDHVIRGMKAAACKEVP